MGEIGIAGTDGYSYNLCSGSRYSKLTTLLVNFLLKFQMLISQICQYFLFKKLEKLLQCKSSSHCFNRIFQCIWLSKYFSVFGYKVLKH